MSSHLKVVEYLAKTTKIVTHQEKHVTKQYNDTGLYLRKVLAASPYSIINNQTSKQQGEHWLAYILLDTGDKLIYDSFGRNNKKIFPKGKKLGKGVQVPDQDSEQHILGFCR